MCPGTSSRRPPPTSLSSSSRHNHPTVAAVNQPNLFFTPVQILIRMLLLAVNAFAHRCVMIEHRRDAHRGSAGLSLTWQGLISRVRLLSRYMSVYRRLLTEGMRPLDAAADAAAAAATSAPATTTVADKPPPPSARRASSADGGMMMPAAGASGLLRRSLEGGVSLPEVSLLLATAGAGGAGGGEGISNEADGDSSRSRGEGEQWGANWVGGSSADIRKLAEQIRTRFGRGALVRNRYGTEPRRELQASKGGCFLGFKDVVLQVERARSLYTKYARGSI